MRCSTRRGHQTGGCKFNGHKADGVYGRHSDVWVLTDRGENGVGSDVMMRFDVFDAQGRFLRQLEMPGTYQPGRDKFFLCDDALIVVYNGDEFGGVPALSSSSVVATDEIEVRCYAFDTHQP